MQIGDGYPLGGVRIVEMAEGGSAAFAGMLLADLGADVVKVERPSGDPMRSRSPIGHDDQTGEQFSHSFAAINRNKRSVVLDLETSDGRAHARRLLDAADVLIEDLGLGRLEPPGLGYDDVTGGRVRGLAYCSLSGFGTSSPYAGDGSHDLVVQGMSGLMSITGEPHRGPVMVGAPIAETTAGLYAALTIAALVPAVGEGRQVRVDCPMLDCLVATSALPASEHWASDSEHGPARRGSAHPDHAPYQVFRGRDGEFTVAAWNDELWQAVAEVVGEPELADDPRFRTQEVRAAHQGLLAGILQARFGGRRVQYWLRQFGARGVPCGPVSSFADILEDEHLRAAGLVQDQKVPVLGLTPTLVYPARISGVSSRLDRAAPVLGADTDEVLAEWD